MRFPASTIGFLLFAGLLLASPSRAAVVIYDDELQDGWTSWSWGGDYDFEHADAVLSGTYCISASVQQYGALSFHWDRSFPQATAMSFWLRGSSQDLALYLTADGPEEDDFESDPVVVSELADVTPDDWAFVSVDFTEFDQGEWTRINFMNTGVGTAIFLVDELLLQGVDPASAEPLDEAPDEDLAESPAEEADAPAEEDPDMGLDDDDQSEAIAEQVDIDAEQDDGGGWGCRTAPGPAGDHGALFWVLGFLFWLSRRKGSVHDPR